MDGIGCLLVGISCLFMYFLPTFVALWAHNINAMAIFILNTFTGWTGIGWIISLVWAVIR